MPPARLRVFVPSVNGGSMLIETLRTLCEQTVPAECVLLDNGSTDGSVERVRLELPDVRIVELGSNLGFGPAINAGVHRYPADLLVFANNDVRYEPRFLECLLDAAGKDDATVAGVLSAQDAPGMIDSAGVIVDVTLLAFDYLHGHAVEEATMAPPPLGPTGAAALVPLSAFRSVGGFDDRIFAYLEDVDLALRLLERGVGCRLAPEARGVHRHSATLGSGSREKNRLMGWSRGYLLRRYGVMREPRSAMRVLATEVIICAGQLAVDRTASGIVGRVSGWRAGKGLPHRPISPHATVELTFTEALHRRAARRRMRGSAARTAAS